MGSTDGTKRAGPRWHWPLLVLATLVCISCASRSPELIKGDPVLVLRIDGPRDDAFLYSPSDRVLVHGMIGVGRAPEREPVDLVILIDVSAASDEPSGFDVDADGELGIHPGHYLRILKPSDYELHCTDPDDAILAAEIAAVGRLVGHVGGDAYGRISLIEFTTDATPSASKKDPTPRVASGAEDIRKRLGELREGDKPRPFSLLAALRVVLATQQTHQNTRRVVALLTPTPALAPGGSEPPHTRSDEVAFGSEILAMATTLRASGIELRVFGIGPGGDLPPPALSEFTRSGGGTYRGMRMPGRVPLLSGGDLDDLIDWVEIENLDSGTGAADVTLWGDGSFSGSVLLREGTNRIRVQLNTPIQVLGDPEVVVYFEREELQSWELLVELERTESRSRELYRLIEREKALRRTRHMKDMEVQVEP